MTLPVGWIRRPNHCIHPQTMRTWTILALLLKSGEDSQ
jgi:hypothetical protein